MKDMMKMKEHNAGKILLVSLLIVLMLAAARFINLAVRWNVIKLEINNNLATSVTSYNFLGLSDYEVARERLTGLVNQKIREVTIVSYYDFIHPAVFLIHSRGKNPLVNLGTLNLLPGKGFVDCFLLPTEIIDVHGSDGDRQTVYYGASLFPSLYWNLARWISGVGENKAGASSHPISFIINPIEKADYLKIPYYIYFYVPLLLILILTAFYGKSFCIAFFYYLGLFLVMDFKKVLFTVPFSWLINLLGVNISSTTATIFAVGVAILFITGGLSGLFYVTKNRKDEFNNIQLTTWGKGLIFFFILLPLFLYF